MKRPSDEDSNTMDKNNKTIPFLTRSQKLAVDLMKVLNMKESIIFSFKEGKVLNTTCLNPLSINITNVSAKEEAKIAELDQNGLLVYHVLFSNIMTGKKTEILCEYEVSTFQEVIPMKSYLCVPKDIYADAISNSEDLTYESNRELVIKEYIEHDILMANQGYLYAYVVNENDGSAEFFCIEINSFKRDLVRIS